MNDKQTWKPQFVIVPDFILDNKHISSGEKLFFGDIASHTKQEGYCWGTNDYFAERYYVHPRTITRWIANLEKRKLIISKMIYQKNSKEVSERRIVINTENPVLLEYMSWYGNQCLLGMDNTVYTPIDKNVQDNNKQVNNKGIISLNKQIHNISNIIISNDEYDFLVNEFGKGNVDTGILEYSSWKKLKNAHPKSDFESLSKWIKKTVEGPKSFYKKRMTVVQESRVDEVSDNEIDEISALIS